MIVKSILNYYLYYPFNDAIIQIIICIISILTGEAMFIEEEQAALVQLGQRLKRARLARDDTQKNFAFRIRVSVPTLHKMEQGSPQVAIGTWVRALSILGKLGELDALLAPQTSLADRYAAFQKTRERQRARKREP